MKRFLLAGALVASGAAAWGVWSQCGSGSGGDCPTCPIAALMSCCTGETAGASQPAAAPQTANGTELPAGTRVATYQVWCYDAGKTALSGRPGVLDVVKLLRRDPFGEWDAVYYDPAKTDPEQLLRLLREHGCERAARVPAVEASVGGVQAGVQDPMAAPGDLFEITLVGKGGAAGNPELALPAGWNVVEDSAGPDGRRLLVQSPASAAEGKHTVRVKVPSDSGPPAEAALTVELVHRVR
jgi:hypothetical protein